MSKRLPFITDTRLPEWISAIATICIPIIIYCYTSSTEKENRKVGIAQIITGVYEAKCEDKIQALKFISYWVEKDPKNLSLEDEEYLKSVHQYLGVSSSNLECDQEIGDSFTKIVTEAKETSKEKEGTVQQYEREGFDAIIEGNLSQASESFGKAYNIFPVYHNVDEIYNRVLTENEINKYNQANQEEEKNQQISLIMHNILRNYSWGMPVEILEKFKKKLVEDINSPDKRIRLSATDTIKNRLSSDTYTVGLVLDWFSENKIGELTAQGRYNALFYLANTNNSAWNSELIARADQVIKTLEEREKKGIAAIGQQTRNLLEEFKVHRNKIRPTLK